MSEITSSPSGAFFKASVISWPISCEKDISPILVLPSALFEFESFFAFLDGISIVMLVPTVPIVLFNFSGLEIDIFLSKFWNLCLFFAKHN